MHRAVCSISQPDFLFVWRKGNTVARTAVSRQPSARPAIAFDLHGLNNLSRFYVADLKTEQIVDVGINQGPGAIYGKRPNVSAERPDSLDDGVGTRIRDRHCLGTQSRQKCFR